MKQSGLCVMKGTGFEFQSTDTYSIIDEKLRNLFPNLFDWIIESEDYDTTTSSWLICMKPPYRKSLAVYSDDQSLPTGFDIITVCQLAKSKAGVQDRVLYLGELHHSIYFVYISLRYYTIVTRDCVPSALLRKWRPSASGNRPTAALDKGSDCDSDNESYYGSFEGCDNSNADISSAIADLVPLPCTQPTLTVQHHHHSGSKDSEEEVISISGKKSI